MGDGNNWISRETAIAILAQYATVSPTGEKDMYSVIAKDGVCEVVHLSEDVTKRTLNYLHRKYGVPMHHWYNPHLVRGAAVGDDKVM